MKKIKYYLIINEENWTDGENGEICTYKIVVKEFNTLQKVEKAKEETYDDSLIIEGNIIDGKLKDFLDN